MLAPLVATVLVSVIGYASTPACNDCSDGDERGLIVFILVLFFTVPGTLALAAGVGGRRFARFVQGLDTGTEQNA